MKDPKIYIFGQRHPSGIHAQALAEDGTALAGHLCSSWFFVAHDMGIESDWKHDIYDKHYPDGYDLVLVEGDELRSHEGFQAAVQANHAQAAKAKGESGGAI